MTFKNFKGPNAIKFFSNPWTGLYHVKPPADKIKAFMRVASNGSGRIQNYRHF